ncbi:hypothetical protein S7335_4291 [Synechococcus sp. PCC 7335]|nr:hypothetical protein S7335_4291 [Synechococcus sp. PCC 7335]
MNGPIVSKGLGLDGGFLKKMFQAGKCLEQAFLLYSTYRLARQVDAR